MYYNSACANARKGPKPKLQRQNVLSDAQVFQEHQQAMETLDEFFNDIITNK